jgi:SAM-dependent methyltransferase
MMRFLRPETSNEVFIDYGAGLGRAVILAAMLPFKRVVGIEISPFLAERARENLSRCRGKLRSAEVEIVNADATTFEVPTDTTTIYFQNPFAGTILAKVLHKIGKSFEQQPRRIKIVCNLPLRCAFCEEICRVEGLELQRKFRLGKERQCLIFSVRRGLSDLSVGSQDPVL